MGVAIQTTDGAGAQVKRLLARCKPAPSRLWRSLSHAKLAAAGIVLLALFAFAAVAAPWLAPYPPNEVDVLNRLKPPVWAPEGSIRYLLGTDPIGRDVLTRLIYGGRVSIGVGFITAAIAGVIGVTLGLLAGYYGGLIDEAVCRVADIFLAFPFILLATATVMMLGPGLVNVILVLSVFGWTSYARVVRGETLCLREKEFVEAARTVGCKNVRILIGHILPNVFSPVIVISSFVVASVIIAEAAMSFLGLGIPPAIPSWGGMLAEGRPYLRDAWWLAVLPGLLIMIVVLALNLVGDWLRDYLDPRLRC